METNNIHNLTTQLVQESKSLWRITNSYITEAATDEEKAFWTKLKADKETHITELKALIKSALN